MLVLERREDETKLQHHKRLIYGKLVDKTLADYDYSELSPYLYGKEYAVDVARRMAYGSAKTLQLLDEEVSEGYDNDEIQEIERKTEILKKEAQKFRDQRREYNNSLRFDARDEHLKEILEEAVEKLISKSDTMYDNLIIRQPSNSEREKTEAVLVLSDWHYGLKTQNIFNEYDTDICKKRIRRIIEQASEKLLLHNVGTLHVVILGDLIHGAIHTSARVASEELVVDQMMNVAEVLAQSIEALSITADYVNVYMTYGNHARTVQNKNDSIHRDNLERIIPWWLKERFKNSPNVMVWSDMGTEFILINANGYNFCATHGDNDTVKKSPRLLYTLIQKTYGVDIDCILLGDKHHRESFDELGVTAMLCGSLCGSDEYANNKRLFSTPSQLMLIVRNDIGIDAEYRLKC